MEGYNLENMQRNRSKLGVWELATRKTLEVTPSRMSENTLLKKGI